MVDDHSDPANSSRGPKTNESQTASNNSEGPTANLTESKIDENLW